MKMSDRRKDLQPREKLQARGAGALSDYELLMAIIGSGTAQADVTKIARDVRKLIAETEDDSGQLIRKRIDFASGNSWDARAESFGNIIEKMS